MLRRVGIGARRQPDVLRAVRTRGEAFRAVEDVVVAVLDGAQLQRCEVAAGVGLGVAERKLHLAARDRRQEALPLLIGPEAHQGRADLLRGDGRLRGADVVHRLPEQVLLFERTVLAAVFGRP